MTTKPLTNKIVTPAFVMCIANDNYPASLELWKVYKAVWDDKAKQRNLIRVIDESEEDYLYPSKYFVSIRVPALAQKAMMTALATALA